MFEASEYEFMARALQLAERGLWSTSPNPRVGCVLVRDSAIVGEGWHQRAGEAHAEIHALRAAGEAARGATAYVTLEPCSHFGRTPPCAQALIDAGVTRVVAAMHDPNPLVSGRGMAMLAEVGVDTASGLLEAEARELNIGFDARMTRGWPWVRVKLAASLDGKTALADGSSQWITGTLARQDGHRWRARACAILTGAGTVRADDPRLNVREVETSRQPLIVVLDSRLEMSPQAKLLDTGKVLVVSVDGSEEAAEALRARGAEVLRLPGAEGRVDLAALMRGLALRGINEVHVEAGARLNGALLASGLVDEVLLYLAPCLIGEGARGLFAGPVLGLLTDKARLAIRDLRVLGGDLRLVARMLRG